MIHVPQSVSNIHLIHGCTLYLLVVEILHYFYNKKLSPILIVLRAPFFYMHCVKLKTTTTLVNSKPKH